MSIGRLGNLVKKLTVPNLPNFFFNLFNPIKSPTLSNIPLRHCAGIIFNTRVVVLSGIVRGVD